MALRVNAGKEALWLDLVRRWQRSKLSVREFCHRHQVSEPSFYSWRRALRERGLLDESTNAVMPAFVKLALDAESTAACAVEVLAGTLSSSAWVETFHMGSQASTNL